MRDFTHKIYRCLLEELQQAGYSFQTFHEFLASPEKRVVVIRHDIDDRKNNSLHFAYTEHTFGIRSSYYFRILPKSYDPIIIDIINNLGHEIGYYSEDLSLARGKMGKAIELFREHLTEFRRHYPVKTIYMHGSPLSRYDNRDLWENYNYRDYGITGEPYFDVDYSKVLYLTDTGRRWDNRISVRDRVPNEFQFHFRSTYDIIENINKLPDRVMFNFHPQRWDDGFLPWFRELIFQNAKNIIKKYFFVRRGLEE